MSAANAKNSGLRLFLTLVVLYGIYLLFASTLTKVELITGVFVAVIATIASSVFGLTGSVRFRPSLKNLIEAWRIPYYAVQGTWEIFKGLAQQLFTRDGAPSLIRSVPFAVGEDDPRDRARRALAVAYTTMTPNFIVLGIAHYQALLLYHQILPGEVLQMTINLGADA